MWRPANCQLEAHLHMGLIEDNEISSPLRQHGMFLKWKMSPQTRGTSAIHQTNHPKMPSNCLLCSVYLMDLLNCCCSFQSWVWHGFSIWFTAMLRLNCSLRFVNVNLPALRSIFQTFQMSLWDIYPKKKITGVCLLKTHSRTQINLRAHMFPVCVCLKTMCLPCG